MEQRVWRESLPTPKIRPVSGELMIKTKIPLSFRRYSRHLKSAQRSEKVGVLSQSSIPIRYT